MSVTYFKLRLQRYLFMSGRIIVKLENNSGTIGYDPRVCWKEDWSGARILTPASVFLFALAMGHRITLPVLLSKRSLPDIMYGLMVSTALSEALHCLKVPTSPYTPPHPRR